MTKEELKELGIFTERLSLSTEAVLFAYLDKYGMFHIRAYGEPEGVEDLCRGIRWAMPTVKNS